ncbi:L,D-transpeptidase [Mesobacillus campisalis]|uniref:L,D-transpeptidase n=1 Tax=Mesobacillus campisalis TaxID=1408103 RepID=A0A0M2SEU9_9BACI|nr:L,D-transpeptidase [Mesobacillus campisalis]KKK33264.1 L,D-transpeptidase [Mesobacillus campisalis]
MKAIILASLFSFAVSPIWPLGENPLPGDPFIVVNKKTNEAALINENDVQFITRAATGKTPDLTPEGLFTVTVKAADPYYRKKDIPGGDPKNPLGSRWIGFDAEHTDGRTFGVHGTNDPESIGQYISQGCIRLHNESVETLYNLVPLGTRVLITASDKSFYELGVEHGAIRPQSQ